MSADNALAARVRRRLADLEAQGLCRTLRPPAGVDLSSNDYLNLSNDVRVTSRLARAIAREGAGSTGSRLLRGEREAFTQLEGRFARFKGTDRALYFSSGYLANLAVLGTLTEAGDVILSDERNHASLIDGARLSRARVVITRHNDPSALHEAMTSGPAADAPVRIVAIESLYSMDGDRAPLRDYAAVCEERGAVLVVDEAHAVGIYGREGSGLIDDAGIDPNRCVSINTAGKALGVAGALVAGPAWAIDYLVQRARPFVFTTAAPPALADAIEASLDIVEAEPERRARLLARAAYVRTALRRAGIDVPDGMSQIIPVVIGDNERAVAIAASLQAEGFDVRAIRPPSVPAGTARLRVSVNAGLSEDVLDRFVATLSAALCSAACS